MYAPIAAGQTAIVITDSTILYTQSGSGLAPELVLRSSDRLTLSDRAMTYFDSLGNGVRVELQNGLKGIIGEGSFWIVDTTALSYPLYFADDTVELRESPSEGAGVVARFPAPRREVQTDYLRPLESRLLDESPNWLHVESDSGTGWIEKHRVSTPAHLSVLDADGEELRQVYVPASGVFHMQKSADSRYLYLATYSSLLVYDVHRKIFCRRIHIPGEFTLEPTDPGNGIVAINEGYRIVLLDPIKLASHVIRLREGPYWPPAEFRSSPGHTNHLVAGLAPRDRVIMKLDSTFSTVASSEVSEKTIRMITYLSDDSAAAVMIGGDFPHEYFVLAYLSLANMTVVAERNLSTMFPSSRDGLGSSTMFFIGRSLFISGYFGIPDDRVEQWRISRLDIGTGDVNDVGPLKGSTMYYRPYCTAGDTLLLPNQGGNGIIRLSLTTLDEIREVPIMEPKEHTPGSAERAMVRRIGDEESGMYMDGIQQLDGGEIVLLYSIHKD